VVHAVRDEMALKLEDVVFRRTELGTGNNPGLQAIESTAELMGRELQWAPQKARDEVDEVMESFARRGPWRVC
jgi:glycerol-3-phosphate dehydrogenase